MPEEYQFVFFRVGDTTRLFVDSLNAAKTVTKASLLPSNDKRRLRVKCQTVVLLVAVKTAARGEAEAADCLRAHRASVQLLQQELTTARPWAQQVLQQQLEWQQHPHPSREIGLYDAISHILQAAISTA